MCVLFYDKHAGEVPGRRVLQLLNNTKDSAISLRGKEKLKVRTWFLLRTALSYPRELRVMGVNIRKKHASSHLVNTITQKILLRGSDGRRDACILGFALFRLILSFTNVVTWLKVTPRAGGLWKPFPRHMHL